MGTPAQMRRPRSTGRRRGASMRLLLVASLALVAALLLPAGRTRAAAVTGTWQTAPALPAGRTGVATVTAPDGTIYAIGGNDNTPDISFRVWNTVYTLKPGTDTTWQTAPSLPADRTFLAATVGSDGTIYAIGGFDNTLNYQSTVYTFKPGTDTSWHTAPSLPTAPGGLAATTGADGTIYVIGGALNIEDDNGDEVWTPQSTVYSFKPGTDTSWHTAPSLPAGRDALAATTAADGTLYAIGGVDGNNAQSTVYSFKPGTDTSWQIAPSLPAPVAGPGATTSPDGTIYAIGGSSSASVLGLSTVYSFKPGTDTNWQSAPSLPAPRESLGVTAGLDGSIYAIGGDVLNAVKSTVFRFVPTLPSTTQLSSSANPSVYGQQLSFTAQVSNGASGITPTGTVTFTDGTATLGTAPLDSSGTATFSTTSLGVGTHSITASYGGDSTDVASTSASLSQQVSPAPLTITANNQSMTYGGSVPAFTASYSGLVNGDASSAVSGLTCGATDGNGTPVSSSTPAGTYAITCSGATATNYSISYQPGTLSIGQSTQGISFGSLANETLGAAPLTVSATGGGSGNPVTFSAGPASDCTTGGTNGATITLVGVGTCTVTANQAGNANYQAATPVAQSFTVSYPPLYATLALATSPAGPVTTGSVVTANFTLGNYTTTTQTVSLQVALTYTGSKGSFSVSVPLKLTLSAGQTLSKSASFPITKLFPRGTYTLSVSAKDGSGDTASSSASLTIS